MEKIGIRFNVFFFFFLIYIFANVAVYVLPRKKKNRKKEQLFVKFEGKKTKKLKKN